MKARPPKNGLIWKFLQVRMAVLHHSKSGNPENQNIKKSQAILLFVWQKPGFFPAWNAIGLIGEALGGGIEMDSLLGRDEKKMDHRPVGDRDPLCVG
jgi:hypothetical protein